jgi:hypothetical protein
MAEDGRVVSLFIALLECQACQQYRFQASLPHLRQLINAFSARRAQIFGHFKADQGILKQIKD